MATELEIKLDPIHKDFIILQPVDHQLMFQGQHGICQAYWYNKYDESLFLNFYNDDNGYDPCKPGILDMEFIGHDGRQHKVQRKINDFIDVNHEIDLFVTQIDMKL